MQMLHNIILIQEIVRPLWRGRKKKKRQLNVSPNTELTDPSWKDSLNCEGDTLLCLSFLRLCQWGNRNKGNFVWVTFQSRICVSCSPINCHKVIAGWCVSVGIPFLACWQLCSMLYAEGCGWPAAEPSWQVPVAAPSLHLLPPPKHLSIPAGNQEGSGKTQSRDMIRNKASNKLSGMGHESRRQAVGCPKEQRVILIAFSKSKETNKSHWQKHKTNSQNSFAALLELQWNKYEAVNQAIAVLQSKKGTLHELPSWELQ